MKKIFGYMVFIVCLIGISSFAGNVFGQKGEIIVIGKVIEIAADEQIIQVKDHNCIVTAVFIDDGIMPEPMPAFFTDLKIGSIVELHINGRYNGFRQAKKVILFTGKKEKEMLEKAE